MIQFLSPLWLFSLFALAVPILIHLLNRRQGRTIKVGSIRFLQESHSHRFKSLKLTDPILLALRGALLASLAIFLAQPYWIASKTDFVEGAQKWVLINPELLRKDHDPIVYQSIDSLASEGYELRLFATGFPRVGLEDSVATPSGTGNYWSLLREVDTMLPSDSKLLVLAPNRLAAFRGQRPSLHSEVEWRPVGRFGGNQWIEEARRLDKEKFRLVIGSSDSQRTAFRNLDLRIPAENTILAEDEIPPVEVMAGNDEDGMTLRLVGRDAIFSDNTAYLRLSSRKLSAVIVHDVDRADDARYIRYAIETAADLLQKPWTISILPTSESMEILNSTELIFWLSPQPLPQRILDRVEQGATVVRDAASAEYRISNGKVIMVGRDRGHGPRLWRSSASANTGTPIWTDDSGRALLAVERIGRGAIYRFHSRFNPMWGELVLSPLFPEWILALLGEDAFLDGRSESANAASDMRRISDRQLLPQRMSPKQKSFDGDRTSLQLPLWLLAVLLFGLERWISERKKI
jgi:hypothetical protein